MNEPLEVFLLFFVAVLAYHVALFITAWIIDMAERKRRASEPPHS